MSLADSIVVRWSRILPFLASQALVYALVFLNHARSMLRVVGTYGGRL